MERREIGVLREEYIFVFFDILFNFAQEVDPNFSVIFDLDSSVDACGKFTNPKNHGISRPFLNFVFILLFLLPSSF